MASSNPTEDAYSGPQTDRMPAGTEFDVDGDYHAIERGDLDGLQHRDLPVLLDDDRALSGIQKCIGESVRGQSPANSTNGTNGANSGTRHLMPYDRVDEEQTFVEFPLHRFDGDGNYIPEADELAAAGYLPDADVVPLDSDIGDDEPTRVMTRDFLKRNGD
ncbi:MAG TPA: hypothetical protein VI588_00905 [Candidatus Gracilibacteria bacterium]|nr:hypothetical protein [Candidatus Gracilibacteria bacterium]